MCKIWVLVFACLLAVPARAVAEPKSGHTNWGRWSFDWEVKDKAGVAIRNVIYNDELVLYKASLPVKRVKYVEDGCFFDTFCGCGPYADRIKWGNLVKISNCGNVKVCQEEYTSGGVQWLELGVYARIGKYHIYQAWYLSANGQIDARVWSKGLSCELDHTHHPYWRLDFDVNGAGSDQVFVFDNDRPNEGWGPGWHKYRAENNALKRPQAGRVWFVRDNGNAHGVWILPGPDGTSDGFSTKDLGARLYQGPEDEPWPFGATGHLGYLNGEDIQEKDVVVWYIAHIFHQSSGGPDQWQAAGPSLVVHR
jgi:hypothetical protein